MKFKFSEKNRHQNGSMLLVVLVVGIVILLLSTATLFSVRNSSKMSGMQRIEYQDIHAAEAGVTRVQQRFNQASRLCSGFFSKSDSIAVAAAMVDTIYTILNPYGPTRAVRVSDFKLETGRPMSVSFISTGGRWTGTKIDTTQKHSLKAEIRMSTLGDFSSFVETEDQVYGGNVNQIGKVHAGRDVILTGINSTFRDEVSYANSIIFNVDPLGVSFRKGHRKVTGNPFSLDRIYINNNTGSACGAYTYKDLAAGTATGEGTGFSYLGSSPIFITLDSIRINATNGNVELPYFIADTSVGAARPPKQTKIATWSLPPSQFNGIVYSSQNIYLEDTLRNFSLTIASAIDIYATGNTRCIGNELLNANNRVTLGLLPTTQFHFWKKSPSSITVEAQIVTPEGNWKADGDSLTHIGRDTLGNACSMQNANCWNLRILGGDITQKTSSAGCWSDYGGNRRYDYDPDMMFSPPPKFPVLFGQSGAVPVWDVAGMGD